MKRLKTIKSYTGHARFIAETIPTRSYLARCQIEHIPSPYRYSPSVEILLWKGRDVVWFETRHRNYEVYQIPANMARFKSDDEATDHHVTSKFPQHRAA